MGGFTAPVSTSISAAAWKLCGEKGNSSRGAGENGRDCAEPHTQATEKNDMKLTEEQQQLVLSHMRLVYGVYSRMKKQGWLEVRILPYDDAISSGYLGLVRAATKFDPSKGISFATYAYFAIKNEIRHNSLFCSAVATPSTAIHPNKDGVRPKFIFCKSQSQMTNDEYRETMVMRSADHDGYDDVDTRDAVAKCLEVLPPQLRDVLRIVYWESDGVANQATKILGTSKSAVLSRIQTAIKRIRNKVSIS
jgi:RNA polymerase sigma factor (sigma-70 family)